MGCCGRAQPVHNTSHPNLLKVTSCTKSNPRLEIARHVENTMKRINGKRLVSCQDSEDDQRVPLLRHRCTTGPESQSPRALSILMTWVLSRSSVQDG